MLNQHPITPPPGLRQLWAQQAQRMNPRDPIAWQEHIANQAAQWGADQELEACCEWIPKRTSWDAERLRAARRPKLPSLKEEALSLLNEFSDPEGLYLDVKSHNTIRRALEALPND